MEIVPAAIVIYNKMKSQMLGKSKICETVLLIKKILLSFLPDVFSLTASFSTRLIYSIPSQPESMVVIK